MEKKKKPIYKRWWAWVIAFIVVVAIAGGNSGGTKTEQASTEVKGDAAAATKQSEAPKPSKITLADYESITTGDSLTGDGGMAYEEVVAKFGEPSSKTESQSGDMKMIIASWTKNINGDFGANFNVTFINGKSSAKSQMSMK
jgi:hypothetical protein